MKFNELINQYLCELDQPEKVYIVTRDNRKSYYIDPQCTILHRVGKPAIEYKDGSEEWWLNGERHREDGPAVTYMNKPHATKYWFVNGKKHRVGGPAVEYHDGTKEWCINDKLHRLDGPAVIFANGMTEWYINDRRLTPEEVKEQKKKIAAKQDIQSHKTNRIDPGMLEDYL